MLKENLYLQGSGFIFKITAFFELRIKQTSTSKCCHKYTYCFYSFQAQGETKSTNQATLAQLLADKNLFVLSIRLHFSFTRCNTSFWLVEESTVLLWVTSTKGWQSAPFTSMNDEIEDERLVSVSSQTHSSHSKYWYYSRGCSYNAGHRN